MTPRRMMIRQGQEDGMFVRELTASSPGPRPGTLVWIHGLGESAFGFEEVMAASELTAWRQLAADLPGYGKSPWPSEPLGLEEHAAVLARWLEAVPGSLTVIGHSMGGVIGSMLCELLAGRIAGFVNIEGNISLTDCGFSSRAVAHSPDEFLEDGFGRLLDGLYHDGVDDRASRTYYTSMRMCDPRTYHRNSEDLVEHSREELLAGRMAALGVPGLYILGHPGGTGERSRELLDKAGVTWRAVDDAGHWPFIDQPQAFLGELASFLDVD